MNNLGVFKIDIWWKAAFWLGILGVAAGLAFPNKTVINPKYLIGLGLGLLLVGVSCWIANKHISSPYGTGIISTQRLIHTPLTKTLMAIGCIVIGLFFVLIMINLAVNPLT